MGVTVWGAQLGFCVHVCVKKGLRKPHLKDGTVKQWWSLKWATRSLWVKALQPHTLASDDYCQIDHFKVPNVLGIKPSCLNAWHVAQKNELRPDATFACAWFSIMSAEFSFFFFLSSDFFKNMKKGFIFHFFLNLLQKQRHFSENLQVLRDSFLINCLVGLRKLWNKTEQQLVPGSYQRTIKKLTKQIHFSATQCWHFFSYRQLKVILLISLIRQNKKWLWLDFCQHNLCWGGHKRGDKSQKLDSFFHHVNLNLRKNSNIFSLRPVPLIIFHIVQRYFR